MNDRAKFLEVINEQQNRIDVVRSSFSNMYDAIITQRSLFDEIYINLPHYIFYTDLILCSHLYKYYNKGCTYAKLRI